MTDRVMVDIETLGLEPGSAIISIGAVRFGPDGLGDTFERSISLESCDQAGLEIDAGTLEWWLEQDEGAREQLTGGDLLGRVLGKFAMWYGSADEVWANSPAFDCLHLEHAFEATGITVPWSYYERRDYRTIREVVPVAEPEQDGTEHDALADAKHQARVAARALNEVSGE